MRMLFWLLDINDEVVDGRPEIRLWGLDSNSKRVLIIDRSLHPYFYLLLNGRAEPSEVIKEVERKKASMPGVKGVELVDRRFFGRPAKALKVTCSDPSLMTKYAMTLTKVEGVRNHLEDDIRYSSRYLIHKDVNPCGWHEVEVEELPNKVGAAVGGVYLAKSPPKTVERTEVPPLRVMSFSMVCYSPKGSPKPDKNPVVILSAATNRGDRKRFMAEGSDDKPVIQSFINYIKEFDPDIIAGYGANAHDWPYLLERAKRHGIKLTVDRAGTEPHTSQYGHISVTGRSNVDFYELADEVPEVKVKTLENIAEYLAGIKREERTLLEGIDIPTLWEDEAKLPTLLKYSMENAESILSIAEVMLDFALQLSHLVGLPLDHVGTAAVGFRTESYIIRQAYKLGELIPQRVEQPYFPYKGAIVLEPKPGLHEKVAVLDFKSMYPNIMINHNISPDTYIEPKEAEPPSGVSVAPEVGHRFRKEPPGLYRCVLSGLIDARDDVRAELKGTDPKSPEYRLLDARQRAIKIITNACYGYAGWVGARWYARPVAEAATAWGRRMIEDTVDLAKKEGLDVIYGDTDSIFVKYEEEKVDRFLRNIEERLGLEIRPDEIYERVLFTEAKKRYAGLLADGRLDIVGLEVARGDWAGVAKKVQEGVLEILLKEKSPDKATEFVRQCILDLRRGTVPYRDLIVWKTLTKAPSEYKVNAPHVEAARLFMKEGWDLTIGDKVGFVIVKGTGRLYERSLPHSFAKYEDLDLQYYEDQQIIPAASRVLNIFGLTEEELRPKTSIKDFMK